MANDPLVGLYKQGYVQSITTSTYKADCSLKLETRQYFDNGYNQADYHYLYSDNEGVFIGSVPPPNNPVKIIQGLTNEHKILNVYASGNIPQPEISPGQLLLKVNDNTRIMMDKYGSKGEANISIGSEKENITIITDADLNLYNNNFNQQYHFSQAHREVVGIIKREPIIKNKLNDVNKFIQNINEKNLNIIKLDPNSPRTNSGGGQAKNPALTECRSSVYEFDSEAEVKDIATELKQYLPSSSRDKIINHDRRLPRTDTLSLSLVDPNYLMESIQGTVVDVYGNALDLNRYPLAIGSGSLTFKTSGASNGDNSQTYLSIMEEQRRGLAYHFEINARKDFKKLKNYLPDVNSTSDLARDRSRFFIDIDKEGQFKINIPASSERGNIPLLSRYENLSTLDKLNPLEFIDRPTDGLDILHDSFAAGISDQNPDKDKLNFDISKYNHGVIEVTLADHGNTAVTPLDRMTNSNQDSSQQPYHLRHGTAYHDITASCVAQRQAGFYAYSDKLAIISGITDWKKIFYDKLINYDIVSKKIEFGKNAGGRSGSINLDGSIEVNIGANTIDKQSIWLDTAGGIVANLGKDKNNNSAVISADGNLVVQIGGQIPTNKDSRFDGQEIITEGSLDIRVMTRDKDNKGSQAFVIRIDRDGINILSPSNLFIHAAGGVQMAAPTFAINSETLSLNGRIVNKYGADI